MTRAPGSDASPPPSGAVRTIRLRPLKSCSPTQKSRIRDIRNQPGVRAVMYTDHEIGPEEHRAWIAKTLESETDIVFLVLDDGDNPVGLVSLNGISLRHMTASWAFYLDQATRGGLGAGLEFALLDYAFDTLHLEKLNCEVIDTNEPVLRLHKKFGFCQEGYKRENIEKGGQRLGVVLLGLTRTDWLKARPGVMKTYKPILGKVSISIETGSSS